MMKDTLLVQMYKCSFGKIIKMFVVWSVENQWYVYLNNTNTWRHGITFIWIKLIS